jgi:hypothetical protein
MEQRFLFSGESPFTMSNMDNYNMLGTLEPTDPLYRHVDLYNVGEIENSELARRLSESLPQEVYLVTDNDKKKVPEAYGNGEISLILGPTGLINELKIEANPFMIYPPLLSSRLKFQSGDQILYQAPEQEIYTLIGLLTGEI